MPLQGIPSLFGGRRGATGGTGPDSVSGLNLWLEARFLTGYSDGDFITSWPDHSGNGNNGTRSTNFAIYRASSINSLPAVEIATGGPVNFAFPDFCSGFTAGEIFILGFLSQDPPSDVAFTGIWTFSVSDFASHFPYTDGTIYESFGTTVRKTVGDPAANLTSPWLYDVRSAASDFEAYLGTTSLFSTGTNTVTFTTDPRLFRNQSLDAFKGTIAMVLMYNRGLTSGERTTIRNYATSIYGVP